MNISRPSFPYLTWDCADELEGRLKKTLYHGGKNNCITTVSSAALADLAISAYIAAAPSPKRKLQPGYLGSISKRLAINPCTMMLGILYCERMRQINPDYLARISSSDLFVVSLVVASKFLNDEGEDDEIFNNEWAEAGGLAVSTVNRLEREFLNAMQWRAYVNQKEFFQFCSKLETSIALKHGLDRGWFSYTDLTNLLTHIHFIDALMEFVHKILQIMVSCTLVYGFSVSILISTVLCFNAAVKTTSMTDFNGHISNPVHPFTNRIITRIRQDIASDLAEDNDTFQQPCNCEAMSPVLDNKMNSGYSCKCPKVFTHHPVHFGSLYRHTSRNFSKVANDIWNKGLSQTSKQKINSSSQPKSMHFMDNDWKAIGVSENPFISNLLRLKYSDTSHNEAGGHMFYEDFLNIARKTNITKSKGIFDHDILFPLGEHATIDDLFFLKSDIPFTYFGTQ